LAAESKVYPKYINLSLLDNSLSLPKHIVPSHHDSSLIRKNRTGKIPVNNSVGLLRTTDRSQVIRRKLISESLLDNNRLGLFLFRSSIIRNLQSLSQGLVKITDPKPRNKLEDS
jgi:hypothetical protein